MEPGHINSGRKVDSSRTGFYCWDVQNNRVFGDANFASIYGLSREELISGVSVEVILSLISEDDRASLVRYIHGVMLGAKPRMARYSITSTTGLHKSVCSVGSVIIDADGLPTFYTGAVMCPPNEIGKTAGDIRELITDAIHIADAEGREITRRYLSSALGSLQSQP